VWSAGTDRFNFLMCYCWSKVPEEDGLRLVQRTRLWFRTGFTAASSHWSYSNSNHWISSVTAKPGETETLHHNSQSRTNYVW